MKETDHKVALIQILQMAYSGEKAAAFAYAGHWRAVWRDEEKKSIAKIEQDEWEHRALVGKMLHELDSGPQGWRDFMMGTIGSVIFLACFASGWYFPMYFAGRLEHANVHEYLDAAKHAEALGLTGYASDLLRLADVELSHEDYFKERVRGHWLTPLMKVLFAWGPEALIAQEEPLGIKEEPGN